MADTQEKRIMGAGVCAGGMVNSVGDDLLPSKPVKNPKTREEWKSRRDYCVLIGRTHEAEWIDRKILYPIGNIINGKYPDDEEFKCGRCKSHVGYKIGAVSRCVVCGWGFEWFIGGGALVDWSPETCDKMDQDVTGKGYYTEKDVGVQIFDE